MVFLVKCPGNADHRILTISWIRPHRYCPSVFVLKPGQMIHINKGRLHMFRKMGPEELHKDDCHAKLREAARQEGKLDPTEEEVCRSVAWDW